MSLSGFKASARSNSSPAARVKGSKVNANVKSGINKELGSSAGNQTETKKRLVQKDGGGRVFYVFLAQLRSYSDNI